MCVCVCVCVHDETACLPERLKETVSVFRVRGRAAVFP